MVRLSLDAVILISIGGILLSSWMLGSVGHPDLWYKRYLRENQFNGRGTAVEMLLMFSSFIGVAVQLCSIGRHYVRTSLQLPPMPTHENIPDHHP